MPAQVVTTTPSAGAALKTRLSAGARLPISPSVFMKLMELGKRADASPADYAKVIETSNALVSKLLATVNSSWFGVRHRVNKVLQAVNLLGTANVRVLAISHCLAAVHAKVKLPDEVLEQYWHGGLLKAVAARLHTERRDADSADEAFLISLLQDIALPLMHEVSASLYEQTIFARAVQPAELREAERKAFGMDHAQAGRLLSQCLGIPFELHDMLEFHHDAPRLAELCPSPALAEGITFASLLPHVPRHWSATDIATAAAMAREGQVELPALVEEIQREFQRLASQIRPAGAETVDLPALLEEASGELADTTGFMVGQIHSMMSNAVQADHDLTAMTLETVQLHEQVREDPLTGLLNRAALDQAGGELLDRLRCQGGALAAVFVDVDDFKTVNDRFGHARGDELLQQLAQRMRQVLGAEAVIARYGGDEFVALLGGVERRAARETLDALLASVAVRPFECDGESIVVSLSVGAVWQPRVGPDQALDDVVRRADELMYRSKTGGKASLTFIELGSGAGGASRS